MMQHLAYLVIDSLFLIVALAIAWFSIMSLTRSGQLIFTETCNRNKHGATRIQANMSPARSVRNTRDAFECHVVTPMTEPQNWQQYGSPTYVRRGIILH